MSLSPEQVKTFETQGFLAPLPVLDEDSAVAFRQAFDAFIEREGLTDRKPGFALHQRHLDQDFVYEVATHPKILDYVESVIGPSIILLGSRFVCKWAGREEFVPWHQDITYMNLEPPIQLTVCYAVDDCDVENGCTYVIPEAGGRGMLSHHAPTDQKSLTPHEADVDPEQVARAVPLVLKSGELGIFSGTILHGSPPNTSMRRRAGFILRYVPSSVRPLKQGQWPAVLVRGVDAEKHFGNLTREQARHFKYL